MLLLSKPQKLVLQQYDITYRNFITKGEYNEQRNSRV